MEDILRMDISAGIVLFNPDIKRLKENIDAVIVQCTHVYLVDNGSGNIDEVLELLKKYKKSKISVICNAKIMELRKHSISLPVLHKKMDMSGF